MFLCHRLGEMASPAMAVLESIDAFFRGFKPLVDRKQYMYDFTDLVKLEGATEQTWLDDVVMRLMKKLDGQTLRVRELTT